jgi:hypothetical protein
VPVQQLGGDAAPRVGQAVQVGQLGSEYGGLHLVQARVQALDLVVVLDPRAIVAQHAHRVGHGRVVGRQPTAVAHGAQVLARVKAPGRHVGQPAHAAPAPARRVRLGAVVQHAQAMARRHGVDGVHVGRLSVQMDRQDDLGARRDRGLDAGRVQVVGARVGLDRDRRRAALADGQPGRDVGVAGHDDLVALAHAQRLQAQVQRVQAIAQPDRMGRAAIGRPLLLEAFQLAAQDEPAAGGHAGQGRIDGLARGGIGGLQVQEGQLHPAARPIRARKSS